MSHFQGNSYMFHSIRPQLLAVNCKVFKFCPVMEDYSGLNTMLVGKGSWLISEVIWRQHCENANIKDNWWGPSRLVSSGNIRWLSYTDEFSRQQWPLMAGSGLFKLLETIYTTSGVIYILSASARVLAYHVLCKCIQLHSAYCCWRRWGHIWQG